MAQKQRDAEVGQKHEGAVMGQWEGEVADHLEEVHGEASPQEELVPQEDDL